MKNVIILQHIKIEDPGYIKDLMLKDNVKLTTVELDEGEKIPTDLIFYTLVTITILGIGSTFTTLPIDRAGLGLVLFVIPTAVIGYVHYKK